MNTLEIINQIDNHLSKSRKGYYSDFYIGITNDVQRRLFEEHNVPTSGHWYIYRTSDSARIAREVEKYYLDKGMKGAGGGGTNDSKVVYCYEISNITKE